MSKFELLLADRNGGRESVFYDPHTSTVTNANGENIVVDRVEKTWRPAFPVSPESPGIKSRTPSRLKIQVGLQCNYSCSYCLQASQVAKASRTGMRDAEIFIENLDRWLEGAPKRIEFWGGEPLLYWKKIRFLMDALHEKFPTAEFLVITNGSLITDDFIEYVIRHDVAVAISHDGPGQHLRGPDPLEAPEQRAMIEKLLASRKGKVSLNAVLTPASHDVAAIERWFRERLGDEVAVNFEGVVVSYDQGASGTFTPKQYAELINSVALACMRPLEKVPSAFQRKMQSWVSSIKEGRTAVSLGQKCGMDRDDQLAVDLLGNVMTCQNTGAKGEHRLGHVMLMDRVQLNTAWHWSAREECASCPVLQLCAGTCMYTKPNSPDWYHSCNNEYAYNLGVLAGALFHLTGRVLVEVKGDILRPDPALVAA
jgi:uncharacterized protein